jgi:NCS1 nucleoside transporter family
MVETSTLHLQDPSRGYGEKIVAVEPGGVEIIPLAERHGTAAQLLWTWMSPNLEFATVFVGVIGVAFFGLSFWMAALAIIVGTSLGSISHGVLSSWGPRLGLPQMVIGRSAFGFIGNLLPTALMSVTAGIGWFAVNSVSGALALNTLTHMSKGLSLVIIVVVQIAVAFFGHNLVQIFERFAFPFLAVVFLIATVDVLGKSHVNASGQGGLPTIGAFLIEVGAAFGYAAGWNPYASDYTRYLRPQVSAKAVGWYAGLGVFVSCALLEIVGAASVTAMTHASTGNPTTDFTSIMPTWIKDLTLLAIALGAVSANVLNVYSGAMSFLAMGIRLPLNLRRAIVALVFGTIGLIVAFTGLNDTSRYENFLLVISYWIGPWLGVVFMDRWLRRNTSISAVLDDAALRGSSEHGGAIAMIVGMVASIWLFANQSDLVGIVPKHHPAWGDITFEVGFVVSALIYYLVFRLSASRPERA